MAQTMDNRSIGKKATLTFFIIVILLSAVVETMICRGGPELRTPLHQITSTGEIEQSFR